MLKLKNYVKNKSRPEGSTAEGDIVEECLCFCYLDVVKPNARPSRNVDVYNVWNDYPSDGWWFVVWGHNYTDEPWRVG